MAPPNDQRKTKDDAGSLPVEVLGRVWDVPMPHRLTLREARLVKTIASGMSPASEEFIDAFRRNDPEVWTALLLVGMQRDDPGKTLDDLDDIVLETLFDGIDVSHIKGNDDASPPIEPPVEKDAENDGSSATMSGSFGA